MSRIDEIRKHLSEGKFCESGYPSHYAAEDVAFLLEYIDSLTSKETLTATSVMMKESIRLENEAKRRLRDDMKFLRHSVERQASQIDYLIVRLANAEKSISDINEKLYDFAELPTIQREYLDYTTNHEE